MISNNNLLNINKYYHDNNKNKDKHLIIKILILHSEI